MFKIEDRNNPNYNFLWQERKVLRALWVKCAPMSYEQILAACVSPLWHEEDAQKWIDMLLEKGVISRLSNGDYDFVLDPEKYSAYQKKRKLYTHFYPDPPYDPYRWGSQSLYDEDPEAVYRYCGKVLEEMKQRLDEKQDASDEE